MLNMIFFEKILRPSLGELLTRVDEQDCALAFPWLGLVEHQDDAGCGGVVKEILRQQDHRLHHVVLDEGSTNVALFVRALVAAAAAHCASVEHHRHSPTFSKRRGHMLNPAPVGTGAWRQTESEAAVGIFLVSVSGEL